MTQWLCKIDSRFYKTAFKFAKLVSMFDKPVPCFAKSIHCFTKSPIVPQSRFDGLIKSDLGFVKVCKADSRFCIIVHCFTKPLQSSQSRFGGLTKPDLGLTKSIPGFYKPIPQNQSSQLFPGSKITGQEIRLLRYLAF